MERFWRVHKLQETKDEWFYLDSRSSRYHPLEKTAIFPDLVVKDLLLEELD